MKRVKRDLLRANETQIFHFYLCQLKLLHRGFKCKLEDKPARVLAHMMKHREQDVSRSELVDLLWPLETHGDFSHRLDKVISKLRAALSDDPSDPLFIKTIRGQGFCFIGADRIHCITHDPKAGV